MMASESPLQRDKRLATETNLSAILGMLIVYFSHHKYSTWLPLSGISASENVQTWERNSHLVSESSESLQRWLLNLIVLQRNHHENQ